MIKIQHPVIVLSISNILQRQIMLVWGAVVLSLLQVAASIEPSVPQGLTISLVTQDSVTVVWTPPALHGSEIDEYRTQV